MGFSPKKSPGETAGKIFLSGGVPPVSPSPDPISDQPMACFHTYFTARSLKTHTRI